MAQKSEKIGEEETKCQHMADLAQHDLDEALPALEEAMRVSRRSTVHIRYISHYRVVYYIMTLHLAIHLQRQ